MAWLLGILSALAGILLKIWNGLRPPVIVAESEKAGGLQQVVVDQQKELDNDKKAADAVARVDAADRTPNGVRDAEANDPYNLDRKQ